MNKLDGLENEKSEVTVKMLDDDMMQLKEKLGYRCVGISANQVRAAIDEDIKSTKRKLDEISCEYIQEIESRLRTSMAGLIREIFDKHWGGYNSLAYDLRILIGQMVDDEVNKMIARLR